MALSDIITALQTDLPALSADVSQLVKDFAAAQAGGTAPTQAQLDALSAVDQGLKDAAAAIKTADPNAP